MSIAPLLTGALAGSRPVSEHETDNRIMDAVVAELCETPLRKLSLEDVADRAGLTRMTVYRRFGDRQRVITATLDREVSRFLNAVVAADDPDAPPSDRIATAFATGLMLAHGHPVVAHLRSTRPGELLDNAVADDGFVIAAGSAFIASRLQRPGAKSRPDDHRRTGELLARLFIVLVLMPPPSVDLTDPDQARELAREVVVPIIARGQGGGGVRSRRGAAKPPG
jgi:AcrR family transcriptional regulator